MVYGEGELRRKPANPGPPGRMAADMVGCVERERESRGETGSPGPPGRMAADMVVCMERERERVEGKLVAQVHLLGYSSH